MNDQLKFFLGFDIETPDLYNERICSMGLSSVDVETEHIDVENVLINPQCEFNQSYKVHNIEIEDVYLKPAFPDVWKKYSDIIMNHILVIHNASCDLAVLKKVLSLYGIEPITVSFIDTLQIARELNIPVKSKSLENLCAYYNIPCHPHDSGEDSKACLSLLLRFIKDGLVIDDFIRVQDLFYDRNELKNKTLLKDSEIRSIVSEKHRRMIELENRQKARIHSILSVISKKGNKISDYEKAMQLYPQADEIASGFMDAVAEECISGKMRGKDCLEILENTILKYPESEVVAESLAKAYAGLCIEEVYSTTKSVKRLKALYDKYPENVIVKEEYGACLDFQAVNLPTLSQKSVNELRHLFFEGEPETIAEYFSGALSAAIENQDYTSAQMSFNELKYLTERFPNNKQIQEYYSEAEIAVDTKRRAQMAKKSFLVAEEALKQDPLNIAVAKEYILSAAELLSYESDIEEKEILKYIKTVYESFAKDPDITAGYVECLSLSSICDDESGSWKTIESIRKILNSNPGNKGCIESYADSLNNYCEFRNEHLNQCVVRLKKLYDNNINNQIVAEAYCFALVCALDTKALDNSASSRILQKIYSIKEQFPDSEDIRESYEEALEATNSI